MAHVGLDYLDRLPAKEVVAYAIAALEREAIDQLRWMDLFLIPVEAYAGGGKRPLWDSMRRQAAHWLGSSAKQSDRRTLEQIEAERIAIAEVEAEIARDFPFYADEQKLDEIHQTIGIMKLARAA